MNETRRSSIIEASNQSGIPVEEIHSRVFRGELPGDGNLAMPGNRTSGFVNAETLVRLVAEGKGRIAMGVPNPTPSNRRHLYRDAPIAQAAEDLGMTVWEVELLLLHRKLEGSFCHPRWVGVRHESLAAYKDQQTVAAAQTPLPIPTDDPAPSQAEVFVSRLRAAYEVLTARRKA
jgi:hypothetical protein